jgi:uncharacterized membrane protein YphA (DoxX/SURF4 family)
VLRWAFTALLLVSGAAKLLDLHGFAAVVDTYDVLPDALLAPAAYALAVVEVGLGVWLAIGRALPPTATLVVVLHTVYLVWIVIALARGLDIPNCGCFGVYFARPLTPVRVLEDVALLALAMGLSRCVRRAA